MKTAQGIARRRREAAKLWLNFRWPLIGAALLLGLVFGANFGISEFHAWSNAKRMAQLQAAAGGYRDGFGRALAAAFEALDEALDSPALTAAVRVNGPAGIAERLAEFTAARPEVLDARFVRPGEDETDPASKPPLGYAALEMLSLSESSGESPPPEVLFFGSEDQHVAWVRRLADGDELLGHVLLALDVGFLQGVLARVGAQVRGPGFVEIEQPVQGKPLVLAKLGDIALRQGAATLRREVQGTPWRLSFWGDLDATAADSGVGTYVWGGLGVLALAIVLATLVIFVRQRKSAVAPVYDGAVARVIVEDEPDDALLSRFDRSGDPVGDEARGARSGVVDPVGEGLSEASADGREQTPTGPPPLPSLDDGHSGLIVEEDVVDDEGAFAELDAELGAAEAATSPPTAPLAASAPAPAPESASATASASEPAPASPAGTPGAASGDGDGRLPPVSVFRAYDVRGVVGQALSVDHVRELGRAIGSEAYDRGQQTIVVARDGRLSSPELHEALVTGLQATGRDVIDIGMVPTPVLYFATYYLNTGSGVMVTGSHNPATYNGLKIMLGGDTLFGDDILALRSRLEAGELQTGQGTLQEMDLLSEYIRRISEDIPVALGNAYRLVIDCGNGVAGVVAPKLFRALGHDVIELYCNVDGSFPNHEPDTSAPENLHDLVAAVKENQADLGFGFDGDGDRLAVVDGEGRIIFADRLMMLFARDILSRNPGAKIVFDVKCSNRLGVVISKLGGIPIMWKTGHSYQKNKLKEEEAELAGEMSGHIFFQERWYGFDDAMYAAARLLEILMGMKQAPSEVLGKLPSGICTPELRIDVAEGDHLRFMEQFVPTVEIPDAEISSIDGIRADYADGWGLIRASNTTPSIVLRFEAHDEVALARIQAEFKAQIARVDPALELPF